MTEEKRGKGKVAGTEQVVINKVPALVTELLGEYDKASLEIQGGSTLLAYGAAVDWLINGNKENYKLNAVEMAEKIRELVSEYKNIPEGACGGYVANNGSWGRDYKETYVKLGVVGVGDVRNDGLDGARGKLTEEQKLKMSYYRQIEAAYKKVIEYIKEFSAMTYQEYRVREDEIWAPYNEGIKNWRASREAARKSFIEMHKNEIEAAITAVKETGNYVGKRSEAKIIKAAVGEFKFEEEEPRRPKIIRAWDRNKETNLSEDELKDIVK